MVNGFCNIHFDGDIKHRCLMKLLIDGYNLLKTIDKNKTLSYDSVNVYCNKLATYLLHKQLEGIIVFDGGMSFCRSDHGKKSLRYFMLVEIVLLIHLLKNTLMSIGGRIYCLSLLIEN